MITILTMQNVIDLHTRIIEDTSYATEHQFCGLLRDEATMEFILEEYNTLTEPFEKAASFLYKVATRHPFMQGNKRLAYVGAFITLDCAGFSITADKRARYEFLIRTADNMFTLSEVCTWLKQNSTEKR